MKVSLNVVKWFLNFELPATAEVVERIGSQLGEVESVEEIAPKYQGAVVVKVVTCEQHPDADKLHVCTVDDGGITPDVKRNGSGYVEVVCGAPNVHADMLAIWLPPGVTVPDSFGTAEPFVLSARELRGVVSNGMLASPKELALSDEHDGILEITGDSRPGTSLVEAFGIEDEAIIEIENKMFTHRPDCFGFLGVAREVSGIFGKPFASPDWYVLNPTLPTAEGEKLPFAVSNELPELVPRFTMLAMRGIKVGPSPLWLADGLARLGQKSINNIVDLTNWYMLETGQPLHAYDYDKVAALSDGGAPNIVVRYPKPGEKIKLLNGKEIAPRDEAVMIATDKLLIGLAGVMGGSETEVDENTKNILIEAATFDMYSVRRTSMAHGLFTEALTRFSKGQSPLQNAAVQGRIVKEIVELGVGIVASDLLDVSQVEGREWVHPPVPVTAEFVNSRLGLKLPAEDMAQLLRNVECSVEVDGDKLTVTAPFWRTDIEAREDVVEEIGRLYGFDHLPLELPKRSITPTTKDVQLSAKAAIRSQLSKSGANEVLSYSFVHGNLLEKAGQDISLSFSLSNALSPELQYYRLSLTPSLLEKVHPNSKAGYSEFALFEIGTVHGQGETDEEGLPKGFGRVALVYAGSGKKKTGAPYYMARKYAADLLEGYVDMAAVRFVPVSEAKAKFADHKLFQQLLAPYDENRSAVLFYGERPIGVVGEFSRTVVRGFKLSADCAGFELFLSAFTQQKPGSYQPLSRFPGVWQDMTLKVAMGTTYDQLYMVVKDTLENSVPAESLLRIEPTSIFQREDDTAYKQITFRINVASYERTLTDVEVTKLLDGAAEAAKQTYKAERI